MRLPLCPSCRERMSSVEADKVGLWSCVYCDGVWLPPGQVIEKLSISQDACCASTASIMREELSDREVQPLLCPSCQSSKFAAIRMETVSVYQCHTCRAAFLPSSAVATLERHLGGGKWNVGQTLAALLSGRPATAADGAITLAALLYALLA